MHAAGTSKSILNSIRRIVRVLRLNSTTIENDLGLSGAQLFVLKSFRGKESLSISEIADRTQTDQSSVSAVVKKLLEKELLRKSESVEDKRKTIVTPTPRGQSIAKDAADPVQEKLVDALQKIPAADRERLAELLDEWVDLAGLNESAAHLFFEE